MKTKTRKEQAKRRTRIVRRRGSTLLIVMVLMGMLSLLGVLFYTFSAQDRSNAEYYSEAAKEHGEPSLDADVLFDFALEQIIVGTNPQFKNSMLWGSRHSLLSNALGFGLHKPGDLHPFNGEGVNVIFDGAGNVAVDQNRNGLPDDGTAGESDNRYLLLYNDSPAAQNEDFNKNGNLDAGEDLNNNGQLDVLVERPLTAEDLNGNGILDAGEDTNAMAYWTVSIRRAMSATPTRTSTTLFCVMSARCGIKTATSIRSSSRRTSCRASCEMREGHPTRTGIRMRPRRRAACAPIPITCLFRSRPPRESR